MPIDHVARAEKQAWPILANLANNNSAPITYRNCVENSDFIIDRPHGSPRSHSILLSSQ